MTDPEQQRADIPEPTDVEVDPSQVDPGRPDGATPSSSASRYEEGDTEGGTGGLDAGGAG